MIAMQFDLLQGHPLESPATERIGRQLSLVKTVMDDGYWHSLQELAGRCSCSEASASARLRDLRNRLGYRVERKKVGVGLYWYKAVHP